MEDKVRCQSCGMSISKESGNLGMNAGEATTTEFCVFCYANGAITNPD